MTEQTQPTPISDNHQTELLEFFKALADANRLKIVGFLAQRPYTVAELAGVLGLSVSTTSNHLSYLAHAGLVSARAQGHYSVYSLELKAVQDMAQRLLQPETLPRLSEPAEDSLPAFDRKVLSTFVDSGGRIIALPMQEKKFQVLLRYVVKAFEPGTRYTEKQVNEILLRFNEDTAALRRGMIEYHLMLREANGAAYWLAETDKA